MDLPRNSIPWFRAGIERPIRSLTKLKIRESAPLCSHSLPSAKPKTGPVWRRIFLGLYSRSWFLAQAYEIAAKAFIDLGDFDRALNYGDQSLRLLPENPLLLVPLANVQIQQSRLNEARTSARQALICLEEFAPPLSVPSAQWPDLQRQLKASCYFVLGRAGVTEALSLSAGAIRRGLLRESQEFLERARSLNPEDAEIVYLLGLSQLSAGQTEAATISFAAAYQFPSALQSKAYEQLKRLHEAGSQVVSFDSFLTQLLRKVQSRPIATSNNPPGEDGPADWCSLGVRWQRGLPAMSCRAI